MPSMKFDQVVLFQDVYKHVYKVLRLLPSVAVKWPLTSTNYNRVLLLTKVNLHAKYEVWPSCTFGVIVFTRFWTLTSVRSNDLWPAPISIGFLYSLRWTYIPNMTFEQVVLFHLSCLQACFQGFKTFTSVAVKWPLTSTNYNRVLLLTKVNLHAKYEVWPSCTFGVIVFTRFSDFDLSCGQMTFDLHQFQ